MFILILTALAYIRGPELNPTCQWHHLLIVYCIIASAHSARAYGGEVKDPGQTHANRAPLKSGLKIKVCDSLISMNSCLPGLWSYAAVSCGWCKPAAAAAAVAVELMAVEEESITGTWR